MMGGDSLPVDPVPGFQELDQIPGQSMSRRAATAVVLAVAGGLLCFVLCVFVSHMPVWQSMWSSVGGACSGGVTSFLMEWKFPRKRASLVDQYRRFAR